jgi:glycosyltransferase involved in cell wall biosynthesis
VSRVLWVSAEAPDFSRGGGAMRQAHLLSGLVEHFDRVDLLLAGVLGDDRVRHLLSSATELAPSPRRLPRTRLARRTSDLWRVLGARRPAEVYDRRGERAVLSAALSAALSPALPPAPGPPGDVVHIEHLGLWGVAPPAPGRLLSLGVQNVPSRMAEQAVPLAVGPRQRWLWGAEAAAARRWERRAGGQADVITVVSAEDARSFTTGAVGETVTAPAPRLLVAPNGVDTKTVRPAPPAPGAGLVFTGTLDFLPNAEGITWFVREVLPLVRARRPDATLHIVGRSPTSGVRGLAAVSGVSCSFDVPAVLPYLHAARAVVVPLRIGTGSRLKVLEAMAAGRPVASTSIGAEGLAVEGGRHLLLGDTAADLARAVLVLLEDQDRAAALAAEARALVETRYSWSHLARTWAEAMALVARGGKASGG